MTVHGLQRTATYSRTKRSASSATVTERSAAGAERGGKGIFPGLEAGDHEGGAPPGPGGRDHPVPADGDPLRPAFAPGLDDVDLGPRRIDPDPEPEKLAVPEDGVPVLDEEGFDGAIGDLPSAELGHAGDSGPSSPAPSSPAASPACLVATAAGPGTPSPPHPPGAGAALPARRSDSMLSATRLAEVFTESRARWA